MTLISDFLDDVVGAEKVVFFDRVPGTEITQDLHDGLPDLTDMAEPWVALDRVSGTSIAVAAAPDESRPHSIRMTSREGDVIDIYFIEDPVAVDAIPEEFDLEVPLPVGDMWSAAWPAEAPFYRIADGALVLVQEDDDDEEDVAAGPETEPVSTEPAGGENDPAPHGGADEVGSGRAGADAGHPGDPVALDGGETGEGPDDRPLGDREPSGGAGPVGAEVAADQGEAGDAPQYLNDAEIIGTECPEFEALLEQPVKFLAGQFHGQKDRRNTQDTEWKQVEMPWKNFVIGAPATNNTPAFGLSRHPVRKNKSGECIVLGSSVGGARKAVAMDEMYAIGLDIDSGATLDEVLRILEDKQIACFVYTSFNHYNSGLMLKRDEVLRKLGIKENPSDEQLRDFLRDSDKLRFEESFIRNCSIREQKLQDELGVKIAVDTPPLEKFRLIFPLAAPVKIIDLAERHDEALALWEDKVTGIAANILGCHFDTSCTDPSRLFFTARHPKEAEDWYCAIVQGKPLVFEDIPKMRKATYTKHRDPNPFVQADDTVQSGLPPQLFLPSGKDLTKWHRRHKSRFLLADLIETHCADKVRNAGGEAVGHVHTECPFEHNHSAPGGTACMGVNAIDAKEGYWTWFCHHAGCQSKHKTEFLKEAIERGWFDEELLWAEEFNVVSDEDDSDPDEDVPMPPEESAPGAASGGGLGMRKKTDEELLQEVLDAPPNETSDKLRSVMKKLIKRKYGTVERARFIAMAKDALVGLTASDLKRLWDDVQKEIKATDTPDEGTSVPRINVMGFDGLVKYAMERIDRSNAEDPHLFHYMENIVTIRDDAASNPKIFPFRNVHQFANMLNRVARFERTVGDDKAIAVSAPNDVVNHLFNDDYGRYPPLRGLVSSPTYSASGRLISDPGYHRESCLYYRPQHTLDVPAVSSVPTGEEVFAAKELLIGECFADFPLDEMTRPEIIEKTLVTGEGLPSVANLMALTLLPFVREMIDGPTPGHLLTKPAPGTGASLLTEVVSLIATGEVTPAMAMPTNKDEMGKTLTSVLANGQNIVFFDNINHSVDSGELASAMTAKTYAARILGQSQTMKTEVRCVWVLTGNNVTLSSELVRRLIMIELNARNENPEKRSGFKHSNIQVYVNENRGRLVWACLTLIQNWVAQGMPRNQEVKLASYEEWSEVMGGILHAAGIEGFLGNREKLKEATNDDTSDVWTSVLCEWWTDYKGPLATKAPSDSRDKCLVKVALALDVDPPGVRKTRNDEGVADFKVGEFDKALSRVKDRVFRMRDDTRVSLRRGESCSNGGHMWSLDPIDVRDAS